MKLINQQIFSIAMNPSLDLSGIVPSLKLNEKSYVFEPVKSAGGNAINAARILSRLHVPVIASGFLGGCIGLEVQKLLEAEKIKHHFISIQNSTRINVTISNQSDHQQTRLSFPGPLLKKLEIQKLTQLLESQRNISFLIMGSSLPDAMKAKDLIRLMKIAKSKNVSTALDCPGDILAQTIFANPLLIKPNLTEFQEMTNSQVQTIGTVIAKAKRFLAHAPYICISSVESGTLLMTRRGNFFERVPSVNIRSTVGAGDSMVGAMVYRLQKRDFISSPADILRWGLSAAAATLSEQGMRLGTAKEINRLYQITQVQTLSD